MKPETFDQIPYGVPFLGRLNDNAAGQYCFRVDSETLYVAAPAPGDRRDAGVTGYRNYKALLWARLPADVENGEYIVIQDPVVPPPPPPMPEEPRNMNVRIVDDHGTWWARNTSNNWSRLSNVTSNPVTTNWRRLLGRGPLKVYEYSGERVVSSHTLDRWTEPSQEIAMVATMGVNR